jgi:hypothetical protein
LSHELELDELDDDEEPGLLPELLELLEPLLEPPELLELEPGPLEPGPEELEPDEEDWEDEDDDEDEDDGMKLLQ